MVTLKGIIYFSIKILIKRKGCNHTVVLNDLKETEGTFMIKKTLSITNINRKMFILWLTRRLIVREVHQYFFVCEEPKLHLALGLFLTHSNSVESAIWKILNYLRYRRSRNRVIMFWSIFKMRFTDLSEFILT